MKTFRKILRIVLLAIFSFILLTSIYENVNIMVKRNELKKNLILDEVNSTVSKKIYIPKAGTTSDINHPGNFCDILITTPGAVPVPILRDIVTFTIGGHAGIVGMRYHDKYIGMSKTGTIETTFNNDDKKAYIIDSSSWNDITVIPDYYILRVKLTEEQGLIIFNEALSYLGDDYNLSFIFNTYNSSYCSDLISKAFRKAGINLNYDFGVTTVLDLAANKYVEMIGYKMSRKDVTYYYMNY